MSATECFILPEPFRRVIAGAEFLDGKQPGWVDLIDLSTLDIASNEHCVLGQIGARMRIDVSDPFDLFHTMATCYGLDCEQVLALGFGGMLDEIPSLNAAWALIVGARRAMAEIEADAVLDAVLAVA